MPAPSPTPAPPAPSPAPVHAARAPAARPARAAPTTTLTRAQAEAWKAFHAQAAAQILAGFGFSPSSMGARELAELAVDRADALVAELQARES